MYEIIGASVHECTNDTGVNGITYSRAVKETDDVVCEVEQSLHIGYIITICSSFCGSLTPGLS